MHNKRENIPRLAAILVASIIFCTSSAFGQGSIFGSVTNSDASVPINGQISFYGFLDDTDEELRIETCVGAGYDAGNWFDDFQNYLTEAPGNPYDYYFYNSANGEGAVLSKLIPNNSFQQEDITLAPVSWPMKPTGLGATVVSSSTIVISWTGNPGETYHVYRRFGTSNGSFFRIDDPSGSLANPGIATNYFVDNNSGGSGSYNYLIIAQNASGNLGPHSDILVVNASNIVAPGVTGIIPNSGSYAGGTFVTISGNGFDINGATVSIGSGQLSSVSVLSPFRITGNTPAGAIGFADVTVTNTASGLSSAPLVSGFNYLDNAAPVLDPIGPKAVDEGLNLNFIVTASDADGTTPTLFTSTPLPGTAAFTDNGNGTGEFDWTPGFADAGVYQVTFFATDDIDTTFEVVDITINEAGNQPPVLDSIGPKVVQEGDTLIFVVTASDPDGDTPTLSATNVPVNATFNDNLNGTGTFNFQPVTDQAGIYNVTFKAFDGIQVDSEIVEITVYNTNQPPVLASIGPKETDEGINLNFGISATDADADPIILFTSALPGTAIFTDSGNGNGSFDWTPAFTEAGIYDITFYATDQIDTVFELVTVTVNEVGNQVPILDPIGPLAVGEGGQLIQNITASDPDGTIPALFADSLPVNASFVDSGYGVGTFFFDPAFGQEGIFNVLFYASDGVLADSELVAVTVTEAGNQPPVVTVVSDTTMSEGDSMVVVVTATDPDGDNVNLFVYSTLTTFNFVDSGNGVGVFRFYATYYDAGSDTVWFSAQDDVIPPATSSAPMTLTIYDVNQPPVIDSVGPFGVAVGDTLSFTITASDDTDPLPSARLYLSVLGIPPNATFIDHGDNTGTFRFAPDSTQVGSVSVTFVATDLGVPQLAANLPVQISVVLQNRPPVITVEMAYTVWEGEYLEFPVTATDPDGNSIMLFVSKRPATATFTDNGDGTGLFSWTPGYTESGLHGVVISAFDGFVTVRENVLIQVYEAGNQEPIIDPLPPQNVTEGDSIVIDITAADPDGSIPTLSADSLPENATFTDNGDGTGRIEFHPTFVQSGTYDVYIYADDGELIDTLIVTIIVGEAGNQYPVLDNPGQQQANEGQVVNFTVTSSDPDETTPYLSASNLPTGATFTDNRDFTGTFNWATDNFDAGDHFVTIRAVDSLDAGIADSIVVLIRIDNVNLMPAIFIPIISASIDEGETVELLMYATDPDSTIPEITVDGSTPLVPHMELRDSIPGVAVFSFSPDYTQGDPPSPRTYNVRFRATDAEDDSLYMISIPVTIKVYNANQPPVINPVNDTSVTEGDTLIINISATDPDGTIPVLSVDPTTLPANATFAGTFNNLKTFTFRPDYTQAGVYQVRFIASDGSKTDTLLLGVTVIDAGNQVPEFTMTLPDTQIVLAGTTTSNHLTTQDLDGDIPTITANPILLYATFVDSGNGAAVYSYSPTLAQIDQVFEVTFIATDPSGAADTAVTHYYVRDFLRGDANSDNEMNMLDIMFLINYLYKAGPAPASLEAADVNFDSLLNLMDPTYLINFFYKQGPPPPQ